MSNLVQICLNLSKLVQIGLNLSKIVQICLYLFTLASFTKEFCSTFVTIWEACKSIVAGIALVSNYLNWYKNCMNWYSRTDLRRQRGFDPITFCENSNYLQESLLEVIFKTKHCKVISTKIFFFQKFVNNTQQCFAFTPQANFPAHNLN